MVAALIKDGLDVPTRDELAEVAKKVFAHFHDRYPHLTTTADDVMIAFRDDDRSHESGDRQ